MQLKPPSYVAAGIWLKGLSLTTSPPLLLLPEQYHFSLTGLTIPLITFSGTASFSNGAHDVSGSMGIMVPDMGFSFGVWQDKGDPPLPNALETSGCYGTYIPHFYSMTALGLGVTGIANGDGAVPGMIEKNVCDYVMLVPGLIDTASFTLLHRWMRAWFDATPLPLALPPPREETNAKLLAAKQAVMSSWLNVAFNKAVSTTSETFSLDGRLLSLITGKLNVTVELAPLMMAVAPMIMENPSYLSLTTLANGGGLSITVPPFSAVVPVNVSYFPGLFLVGLIEGPRLDLTFNISITTTSAFSANLSWYVDFNNTVLEHLADNNLVFNLGCQRDAVGNITFRGMNATLPDFQVSVVSDTVATLDQSIYSMINTIVPGMLKRFSGALNKFPNQFAMHYNKTITQHLNATVHNLMNATCESPSSLMVV